MPIHCNAVQTNRGATKILGYRRRSRSTSLKMKSTSLPTESQLELVTNLPPPTSVIAARIKRESRRRILDSPTKTFARDNEFLRKARVFLSSHPGRNLLYFSFQCLFFRKSVGIDLIERFRGQAEDLDVSFTCLVIESVFNCVCGKLCIVQ